MHKRGGEQKVHSSTRNSRVLIDSTNTRHAGSRTGDDTMTHTMKPRHTKEGADLIQRGKRRGCSTSHHYSPPKEKTAPGLNDLLPQDKAKIARLVEQVMQLSNENADLKEALNNAELEKDQCDKEYDIFQKEKQSFIAKRNDSLLLLRRYQDKIQFFSDELLFTRKAYDELTQRYNSCQNNLNDLEVLVNNQKQTIDYEKKKHQVLVNSSKELQELKDELRHKNEDCVRYKTLAETSESNSKFLASQLDGLLSQLTDKTNRIQILEASIRNNGADQYAHNDMGGAIPIVQPAVTLSEPPYHSSEQISSSQNSTHASITSSLTEEATITNSSIAQSFQETLQHSDSDNNAMINTAASPPVKPRKVHTPEQLLASWSLEQLEEEDSHRFPITSVSVADTESEQQKTFKSNSGPSRIKEATGTKNTNISSGRSTETLSVKDEVAYDMTLDMSKSKELSQAGVGRTENYAVMDMEKMTTTTVAATAAVAAGNTHSTSPRCDEEVDEVEVEENSVVTASMREAAAVHIAAPPLSLTPPRNISLLNDKEHRRMEDFNDSSMDSTILKPSGGNQECELTDEFFLETANRHFVHQPVAHTVTSTAQVSAGTSRGSNDFAADTSDIHLLESDSHVQRRKGKRVPGKTMNVTTRSSSTITQNHTMTLKSQSKNSTQEVNFAVGKNHTNTKQKFQKSSKRVVFTSERGTRNLPPSSPKNHKKYNNNNNTDNFDHITQPPHEEAKESPGLKAWEEGRHNFDGGYGMQLFDLLDQIDDVPCNTHRRATTVRDVMDVDVGIYSSLESSITNNSHSHDSSFQDLLDNSDSWM